MPPDVASDEQGRMQGFVAALLRHEGALVEPIDPEGLEVLAPPPVQHALGIGELTRLGFGTTRPPAAQRVGLEGDWLDRFARLLGSQGRFGRRVVSAPARAPGDLEQVLRQDLVLDNATFRLIDVAPRWTRYLVLDFRASAVSDDKRDWMVRLGVNLATGALPDAGTRGIGAASMRPALMTAVMKTAKEVRRHRQMPIYRRTGIAGNSSASSRAGCRPDWTSYWVRSSKVCGGASAEIRTACICTITICIERRCAASWPCPRMTRGDAVRSSARRRSLTTIARSSTI